MQSFHNSWYWKHIYLTCDWINSYHRCSPCIQYRSSPPEVFLGKGVPKICSKFTGKHPCRSVVSIKSLWNFIEIALWRGCSPANLLHIFRTPFPMNTSGGLLQRLHGTLMLRSFYLQFCWNDIFFSRNLTGNYCKFNFCRTIFLL